jgi:hypothetical protein
MASAYRKNLSVFSNGQLALPIYCGLKIGPVKNWLKTRWLILQFENQTQIVSGFQMVTVFGC